jgi:DNA-binding MarR family transcriptional regulator
MPRSESEYDRRVLEAIASGRRVTQRSLSSDLGVALGLTNLLIRRLVLKGYVKVSKMGTRHVRYLMTPAGWEALASATRQSLENTVHLYTETREHIRSSLSQISGRCRPNGDGQKRIVFYGAGDVAEIAYVSLQTTDLTLVGVVDDWRSGRFFNLMISGADQLSTEMLGSVPFDHLIVTTLRHADAIRSRLAERGMPADRIFTLI